MNKLTVDSSCMCQQACRESAALGTTNAGQWLQLCPAHCTGVMQRHARAIDVQALGAIPCAQWKASRQV
jgi:hypothetical protein